MNPGDTPSPTVKVRYRYTKVGKVRFVGHRDLCGVWERVLRRVRAPLAHSEGFNVRPRLSFGLALPVGAESDAEYMDAQLIDGVDEATLAAMCRPDGTFRAELQEALPDGVDITGAGVLGRGGSLQHDITSVEWRYTLRTDDAAAVAERLTALLQADSFPVPVERKGKVTEEDIRPGILALTMDATESTSPAAGRSGPSAAPVTVSAELANSAALGGKSVRPGEVAAVLAPGASYRLRRTAQWIERDDPRRDPLWGTRAAGSAPHTAGCAS